MQAAQEGVAFAATRLEEITEAQTKLESLYSNVEESRDALQELVWSCGDTLRTHGELLVEQIPLSTLLYTRW